MLCAVAVGLGVGSRCHSIFSPSRSGGSQSWKPRATEEEDTERKHAALISSIPSLPASEQAKIRHGPVGQLKRSVLPYGLSHLRYTQIVAEGSTSKPSNYFNFVFVYFRIDRILSLKRTFPKYEHMVVGSLYITLHCCCRTEECLLYGVVWTFSH